MVMVDKFVEVDGIRTRYLEEGEGHPIVLFHGGEFGGNTGAHVFPPEFYKGFGEAGHRAVGIDRLGQAQTDNPRTHEDYRISAVIAHSIATLEALSITNATVLGQSRGAYVAARIAVERPDLVRRLVLINSGTLAPGVGVEPKPGELTYAVYNEMMTGEARNDAEALSYTFDHITDAWLEECQRYADAEKSKEARSVLSSVERAYFDEFAAQKDDTLDRLAAGGYTGPTLIVWGVGDRTLTHESSIALFNVFKDQSEHLRMHVINHAGHSVFREYPDEVSRQVVDFIATT